MKRNAHPYMSSTYINGYVKDQSLRNMNADEVLNWFNKVGKQFGRKPLKHNGRENLTIQKESVQGKWTNTMWNQYPKHLMEPKIIIPSVFVPLDEKKPIYKKKVKEHRNTYVIRRQYRHIETIM